jgi:hypothetical protein
MIFSGRKETRWVRFTETERERERGAWLAGSLTSEATAMWRWASRPKKEKKNQLEIDFSSFKRDLGNG